MNDLTREFFNQMVEDHKRRLADPKSRWTSRMSAPVGDFKLRTRFRIVEKGGERLGVCVVRVEYKTLNDGATHAEWYKCIEDERDGLFNPYRIMSEMGDIAIMSVIDKHTLQEKKQTDDESPRAWFQVKP